MEANNPVPRRVSDVHEALMWCDYMAAFTSPDFGENAAGIARVIRNQCRQIEEAALRMERLEACIEQIVFSEQKKKRKKK